LCGVFFAVGYVVGGNSVKSGTAGGSDSSPAPVAEGKRDEPAAVAPIADAMAANGAAGASGSPISDPAGTAPGPEPRMSDNPAAAGSAPPPSTTAQAAPAPAPVSAGMAISVPETGATYLQVTAQERPRADDVAKSLRDRNWPAILAESSKPPLVEVLVGPYHSAMAVAEAKRKLMTDLGFAGVVVHKY
jgi:hypothetical protein